MSKGETRAPRMMSLPAAAIAALLLAGCSSGHVGDDWQCPLAAGGSCASVAAADPAVPKTDAVPGRAPGQPIRLLPREWDAGGVDTSPAREPAPDPIRGPGQASMGARACEAECSFDPLGWLARLFGAKTGDHPPEAQDAMPVGMETAPAMVAASSADSLAIEETPAGNDPGHDDLRTGETVARIWIAPFVDADGVYREAAHVRVVLEPAGWRLK